MRHFKILTFILFLICSNVAYAESDSEEVRDVIQQYIDGSSYSQRDQLIQAFHPDATLYLTGKDGFARYDPKQYADFFAHREAGKFNGRIGKILSVEIINDIATAKASIRIADRDLNYIDLFLLKKTNEKWQIISKTATKLVES